MFRRTEFKIALLRLNMAVENSTKEIGINAANNGISDFLSRRDGERIRNASVEPSAEIERVGKLEK